LNGYDDLVVGQVRESFNGKLHHHREAANDQDEQQSDDEPAIVQEKVNDRSQGLSLTHGALEHLGFDHERAADYDLVTWPQPIHDFSFTLRACAHRYGLRTKAGSIVGDKDNGHAIDVLQGILGYEDCASGL
jgi:hypothetical protein